MAAAKFQSLKQLRDCFARLGAVQLVAKPLSENDNIKQQIYLGGGFESLTLIPYGEVVEDRKPKTPNLKASIRLLWITESGAAEPAPHAKLILYPQYPEVRLSGFVRGTSAAPSELLQPVPQNKRRFDNAPDGRVLLFGIADDGRVFAYLAAAGTAVARAFIEASKRGEFSRTGVFLERRLDLPGAADSKAELLRQLRKIRAAGWHESKRLRNGVIIPYNAPNGGGYTLEALFGISPNSEAAGDFLGWELKACGSDRVTLMTPEPNGGYYGTHGAEAFLRKYGRPRSDDVIYFTGIHKAGVRCPATGQVLRLRGFDAGARRFDAIGRVELIDSAGVVSAAWSFAKLLEHWGRKHARAAYVPCSSRAGPPREYTYESPVQLGEGTDFLKFLSAVNEQSVYYDPGPKLERASTKSARVHARSQFRIRNSNLPRLYSAFTEEEI